MDRVRRYAPDVLAAIFAVSGVGHLVRPGAYESLIPPFLPAPGAIIAISGGAELICALGLLRRDRWAGPTSAALLVAVFPGNVWFAIATTSAGTSAGLLVVGSWLRLPLQLPLIWAALQARAGARR
ncbi:MAG: DoxX family protein [Chloroflexota bacterium]